MTELDVFKTKVEELLKFRFSVSYFFHILNSKEVGDLGYALYANEERFHHGVNKLFILKNENSPELEDNIVKVLSLFNKEFLDLFKLSHKNNFFYIFCSSEVYKAHFENYYLAYKEERVDVNLIEFIVRQLTMLTRDFFVIKDQEYLNSENNSLAKLTYEKKIAFLKDKAKGLGYVILQTDEETSLNNPYYFTYYNIDAKIEDLPNLTGLPSKDNSQPKTNNFDPNHFNERSYDLFLYLVENYLKDGKIKYLNIYEFMKKEIDKENLMFRFTQKTYTKFILSKYGIELKKFKVADFLYEDEEKSVLHSHEQRFNGR